MSPSKNRNSKYYIFRTKARLSWWLRAKPTPDKIVIEARGCLSRWTNPKTKKPTVHRITIEFFTAEELKEQSNPIKLTACRTCPYGASVGNPCSHVNTILDILGPQSDWRPMEVTSVVDISAGAQERREKKRKEKQELANKAKRVKTKNKKSKTNVKKAVTKRKVTKRKRTSKR